MLEAPVPGPAHGDRARRVGLGRLGRDRVGVGRRDLGAGRRRDSAAAESRATAAARRWATIGAMAPGYAARQGPVRQFSTEHLAALGVTAAAAALSIATARRGSERAVRLLSRSLALSSSPAGSASRSPTSSRASGR